MSWEALAPRGSRVAGRHQPAVTLSVSKASTRQGQKMLVNVYAERLEAGMLPWWKPGAAVEAQIGAGEHAGLVRIAPGGPFRLSAFKGRRRIDGTPRPCGLHVSQLAGMPADGLSRVPAWWEIVGNALVVTLPWSGVKGAVKLFPPAAARYAPPPPPVEVVPARTAITDSYANIQAWAIEHQLGSPTHGFDLLQVNRRRVELGERPFIIRKTVKSLGTGAFA